MKDTDKNSPETLLFSFVLGIILVLGGCVLVGFALEFHEVYVKPKVEVAEPACWTEVVSPASGVRCFREPLLRYESSSTICLSATDSGDLAGCVLTLNRQVDHGH